LRTFTWRESAKICSELRNFSAKKATYLTSANKQGGGYVIVLSFCLSVNRITDERGTDIDETWQTYARGDSLEVIYFWC